MTDDELGKLLRTARPPTEDAAARRDLWPAVVKRLNERPRWSLIDIGLATGAAAAVLVVPQWLWLLVYHL
jgi:hypothetical protein